MSVTATRTYIRKRNASCSLLKGLSTPALEDVDTRVDEDPHHVDEVPVDARHLDAAVLLSREVAAEGPGGRERQQRQADEDVGAVEAGETVKDRALSVVVRGEA